MVKRVIVNKDDNIGKTIEAIRVDRGLSMTELARKTGFSVSAISRWESGNRVPNIKSFNKILDTLNAEIIVINK